MPMTDQQFVDNDALDRQRLYMVLTGLAGTALGVDPGPTPYDGPLSQPVGQHRVLSVTTGTAAQGLAGTVTAQVGGSQITLPMIVVIGLAAWLILK